MKYMRTQDPPPSPYPSLESGGLAGICDFFYEPTGMGLCCVALDCINAYILRWS